MTVLIAIMASIGAVLGAGALFLRADPVRLAASLRALSGSPRRPPSRPRRGGRSMVRTAALEMELDHDTGALEGLVLAGSAEGRMLGAMGLGELRLVYRELSPDGESRQLLETYLDGRFPAWRRNAQAHDGERLGVAPRAGAMTKEEAYKVLGLEAGAAAADIREAHRRLMQRLNPDVERTALLVARIDQAKDVLLSDHD